MDPRDWIHKALDELTTMVSNSTAYDTADSWRAAVLIARLLGSPTGPTLPAALAQRLPEWLRVASLPDHETVLNVLADELDSDGDPWGTLLDALLDADDTLGVLGLAGRNDISRELSARVAALMSLYPERALPLGAFAQMRLETVHADSVVAHVWRSVERAPALILADALPAPDTGVVDEIGHLAIQHPWFKAAYARLQRSLVAGVRAVANAVDAVKVQIQPVGMPLDLAATLGESRVPPLAIALAWGEVRRLDLPLGSIIGLSVPSRCQLWYATSSASALLPDFGWQIEPNESPVLITATESTNALTLEDALTNGCQVAGLVLVEAAYVGDKGKNAI